MLSDFTYAVRTLARHPWFACSAVVTLALGIGANTAIFAVLYGVLLRPLPFKDADRLVRISETLRGARWNVSYANFLDWRARNHVFADMAIFNAIGRVAIRDRSGVATFYPSGNTELRLFDVLGVQAAHGRLFAPGEDKPDTAVVAVISDAMWRTAFGGDPAAVGRTVLIDDEPVTIVGILPPDVRPSDVDVWFPIRHLSAMQLDRGNHPGFAALARLRDGVTLDDASREMTSIAQSLQREYPSTNRDMGVHVEPLLDSIAGSARPTLLTMMGAVAVLLLIACANVANLLLAKGLRRERETSIRAALGATRLRLLRLFLMEGAVLGLAGATAGLLAAAWSVRVLPVVPGMTLPRAADVRIDPAILGFALALGLVTAMIFALAPALQLSRVDLMRILRLGGIGESGSSNSRQVRTILVGVEVGLLFVMLAGAGLMIRTLGNLAGVNAGFDADRILSVRLQQPPAAYQGEAAIASYAQRLQERARHAGGVGGAAIAWPFDYTSFSWAPFINFPDQPFDAGREPTAQAASVTPEYFATMGIPFVRGRNFGPQERAGAPTGLIVNQTFATRFFHGADPIGKRVTALKIPQMQNMPIIGVVGDTRRGGLLRGFTPEMYVAFAQFPVLSPALVVRAAHADPLSLANEMKAQVAALDPAVAVSGVARVADELAASYGDRHALSWLLSAFAVLALLLTVLGIASVVSFTVAQRTTEIGIRLALGANRRNVIALIVGGAMRPVAGGAAAGLVTLPLASRALRAYLFGVTAADPLSIGGAVALLVVAALAAAYLPARRAAAVDPLLAIRSE
ncbi:MAG TPA: ABC transporter permease [Vicinamibacterales bacterium]|nr:ABC transporter permease [Vicinamibacterales bacterium]